MSGWNEIQAIGVGYLENLGGPLESKWPHSAYTFEITVDRDIMTAQMRRNNTEDDFTEICCVSSRGGLEAAFSQLCQDLIDKFGGNKHAGPEAKIGRIDYDPRTQYPD